MFKMVKNALMELEKIKKFVTENRKQPQEKQRTMNIHALGVKISEDKKKIEGSDWLLVEGK